MSSVCRTSTNWRCCRSTSFLPIADSSSAPAQLALGVAAAPVSPQLQGRLASTITPSCVTLPSCALHCHAGSGCGGGLLNSATIEAPTHGQAPSTGAAEQSIASSAGLARCGPEVAEDNTQGAELNPISDASPSPSPNPSPRGRHYILRLVAISVVAFNGGERVEAAFKLEGANKRNACRAAHSGSGIQPANQNKGSLDGFTYSTVLSPN
eukprot:scaffold23772_cov63-Phaeocystis_antarctica.AAC.2